MPPDHQAYLQWNGERFIRWAEQIGQHTAAVVRIFLSAHKVEQQGYKSCMALLKLAERYSPQRLESACRICWWRSLWPGPTEPTGTT